MVMDITEQVENSTGRREEGLLGTVSSFIHKLVGGGGVLLSGLILSFPDSIILIFQVSFMEEM